MSLIVIISNYLVQFPVNYYGLKNVLTYGAFSYPITFLITDLANRAYGKKVARTIVIVGFVIGVFLTLLVSNFSDIISIRIASELNLDINEPYVEILEIPKNSLFVAKKAKTYEEEKNVANKAPVNSIFINNLNKVKTDNKKVSKNEFSYIIKIADFYFKDTARVMLKRITDDTKIKNPKIKKISNKNYRVYLGPFSSINSLQKSFNDINILKFENIEFIKND